MIGSTTLVSDEIEKFGDSPVDRAISSCRSSATGAIRTILLHALPRHDEVGVGPAAFAISLAAAVGSHLKWLAFDMDFVTAKPSDADATLERRVKQLEVLAKKREVDLDVVTERSFVGYPDYITEVAQLSDLIVCGVDDSGLLSERTMAEHLLFSAGRPILVVPPTHQGGFEGSRCAVAWDGSSAAARALGDALPFLRKARQVTFISVRDEKRINTSLSEETFKRSLQLRGFDIDLANVSRAGRSVARALGEEAVNRGADLLVMGGFGHSRLREFILGGATRGTLEEPILPTLLSH